MASSDISLQGWKEIANALGVGVRTAQRWERDAGLPVHRIPRFQRDLVCATRPEIGAWQSRREMTRQKSRAVHHAPPRPDEDQISLFARGWRYIARIAVGLFLVSR